MTKGRFRHLPVISGGKLTGIISIGDVVKRKIQKAEQEAEEMKRYIAGQLCIKKARYNRIRLFLNL